MNLTRLFEMQKALDEKIIKEKGLEGQDLLPQKILALQVELGECANEWRGFKFWSKNQEPRTTYKCKKCNGQGYRSWWEGSYELGNLEERGEPCDECCGEGVDESIIPLLEEYVDCLHFILSIGHETGHDAAVFKGLEWVISKMFLPIHVIESFTELMSVLGNDLSNKHRYQYLVWEFINLGYMLGFTWEQIEQAYISKNEVNHQRQVNGY